MMPDEAQRRFANRAALLVALTLAGCGGGGGSGSNDSATAVAIVAPSASPSISASASPPASPPASPQPSPPPTTTAVTWELILQPEGVPATPPQVTYLDLDGFGTTASYVAAAKAKGIKTICYISAGTAEDFRPDFAQFKAIPNAVGKQFPGFPGDFYLNLNIYVQFLPILDARLSMCKAKGFDMVDFDVIDSYADGPGVTGFSFSQATAIAYVTELVRRANGYGLKAVQKNTSELSVQFQPIFAAALFEECVRLNFCADGAPYVTAGKPVFNVEYPSEWPRNGFMKANVCDRSANAHVLTIISTLDLNAVSDRC